jgi:D-beta-D-heptose 7-phosphate kinase/D-beta-D-heptose 1-phosphate adenosyltransferase
MTSLVGQLAKVKSPNILVLGDLILDRYTFGNAERVSPEAPVLVLRVDEQEVRLGGAASVAFLLRALGARVTLAGVVGEDQAGRLIQKLAHDAGIDCDLVVTDSSRLTTTKERFVGRAADRHPHQMLRVDSEMRNPIAKDIEAQFGADVLEQIEEHDAVLISDYAKGVCSQKILSMVITGARLVSIPSVVDPARTPDFGRYNRADVVKPNRFEAEYATGQKIRSPQDALIAGQYLCRQHEFGATLITLDREGMALVQDDESEELFPTMPHEVYDITGAGDMALAALGLCLASDLPLQDSIHIANAAAGLEVERLGVAAVTLDELRTALNGDAPGSSHGNSQSGNRDPKSRSSSKIVSADEVARLAESYRRDGKVVVFTNGCFDLFHVGHMTCLEDAAALGDVLIVGVNGDATVRELKGHGRPIYTDKERAGLLAAMECVDHVVVFHELTPHHLLDCVRPDILIKGGTSTEIVGQDMVEGCGGRAFRLRHVPNTSTTEIIARICELYRVPASSSVPESAEQVATTDSTEPPR